MDSDRHNRRSSAARVLAGLFAAVALSATAVRADDAIPAPVNEGAQWKVFKSTWGVGDEAGYAAFVQAIGRSDCSSLDACLKDKANPYRHTDKRSFRGDCADMAYMLRAYYAWKNGLPFSYQNAMRTATGARDDLRYSSDGNVVSGRRQIRNIVSNAPSFIARIGGEVSTAMFRTHPVSGGGKLFDDFYPVEISREAIRAGSIIYDIYGHVGIVYDILEDGRILVVASHPDDSVTRTVYGPNFLRSKPALGAGIKAWRPIYVKGAKTNEDGSLEGGKLISVPNEALRKFSLEQYIGNVPHPSGEWHYGEFRHEGRTLSYYDYVRRKLAAPGFAYNPVDELAHGLDVICGSLKSRKAAVDRAVDARIHHQRHPDRLPTNIYGTYGAWEDYSTPSRDARLKISFIELRRTIQRLYEKSEAGDASVAYDGDRLGEDLWETFEKEKNLCQFTYRRSDDTRVRLNLGHVMDRLWDLSFDPYHCPERRWGATGAELSTCSDNADKTKWYNAQRHLRYQAERTYDVKMSFTADELKPPMMAAPSEGGLGVDAPADADLRAYLIGLHNPAMAATSDGVSTINASFRPQRPYEE